MDIGSKIKELRESKGLTQKELGKRIGVTAVTITRYERGDRNPSIKILNKIADALEVPVNILINDKTFSFILLSKLIENIKSDNPLKKISDLTSIDYQYLLYTYSSSGELNLDAQKKILSCLNTLNEWVLMELHTDITLNKNFFVEDEILDFIEALLGIDKNKKTSVKIDMQDYLNNETYLNSIKSKILKVNEKYNILITDKIINEIITRIENLINFELFNIKNRIDINKNKKENK